MTCPACGSHHFWRSHRTPGERALTLLIPLRRFRCRRCLHRRWAWVRPRASRPLRGALAVLLALVSLLA